MIIAKLCLAYFEDIKMSNILIKNGKIWDGDRFYFSDLLIENGKIATIAKMINVNAEFIYDAKGQIVSVGFIDSHLHLRPT